MTTTENPTTWDTFRSTAAVAISSSPSTTVQNYIGVWCDENQHAHAPIKQTLHDIFNSFEIFTDFVKCITYIDEPRPAKIFFIVSHDIGKYLIPLMFHGNTLPIEYVYIYCTNAEDQKHWNSKKSYKIEGAYIQIESLIEQIKNDISAFNDRMKPTTLSITPPETTFDDANPATKFMNEPINHTTFYAVPSTFVLDENLKNTSIKDLSRDYVWFIQFQLLVEILIRLEESKQAKEDILWACRNYYKDDACQQRKINEFEREAEDISRVIYWYTAESFIIHLLNEVCSTEDVDHLFYFRLIISNLHKRIVELENDTFTITLRSKNTILYRGKRMAASILENFRKSIGSMVAMKGFLSTTTNENVAKIFAGDGIEQTGTVCVLFKLNIVNWEECKSSAAIKSEDSAMKDEEEVLFSIGSIWKINKVENLGKGIWSIELISCPESNARSIELTNYLREQLGDISDLWTLGDFLMKIGEYKKAEKYYIILQNNLPEKHVDRAKLYNRLGIIYREGKQLNLAIGYFKKAVDAAPPNSNIQEIADDNMQIAQTESQRPPIIFLGKRLASSDVITKSLVTNEFSTAILKNNLGHATYHEKKYDEAIIYYKEALSIMKTSELSYLHEISCVYNNLGAIMYEMKDYSTAKEYFQNAIFKLQEFTSKHPWIAEYKQNLVCAQQKISKKQKIG